MPSLINTQHFFNEFSIGQVDFAPVAERLQEYIDTYETEYLEGVLGADFAALFNAGIADSRFDALKEQLIKKPSPIAAYVFFTYQNFNTEQATAGADAKLKVENSTSTINVYRMVNAWNIMVDKSRALVKWLTARSSVYPEFDVCKVDGSFFIKTNPYGL